MTTYKKSITKSAKSGTPVTNKATKSRLPVTKAAKTKARKASPPIAAVPAAPASRPAPAASAKRAVTTIRARIDVGFGNALYVRGEGPGLNWDQGVPMTCVDDDEWVFRLGGSSRPFVFKLLVNDLNWNTGPDYTIVAGESLTVVPSF